MSIARKIGNLGTALDSAALSTFLSKGTTDGEFDTIAWGDVTGKPSYIDSSLATQLFDSAYVQLRQSAVSSGGLDSAAVVSLIDSNYVAARASAASSSGFIMYNYNATSGQTAFQDSDTAGNVLSYTADGILVYYNGLLLADEDYTATDGSAVTLTEGADSGAQITIGKWNLTGAGSSGSAAVWYGDRALVAGGNYTLTDIEYFDITTTGGTADFGDLSQSTLSDGDAASDGTYGLFMGGYAGTFSSQIDYVTISTLSNGADFGDITEAKYRQGALSNGTYALSFGGYTGSLSNVIDYVTIATPANAQDFGDLTNASQMGRGAADNTRGVMNLGWLTGSSYFNNIDYVTVASPSNASDFGDLTVARRLAGAVGDGTYVIWSGGNNSGGNTNVMDYVTVQTTSNATDFGDSTVTRSGAVGASNDTRGTFSGGYSSANENTIDYITMATPSNATDFGDLTTARTSIAGGTSGSPS